MYQPRVARSSIFESADPHGNGTITVSAKPSAVSNHLAFSPAFSLSKRNCQGPFRFIHAARSKSGRGCSGRGIGSPARTTVHARTTAIVVKIVRNLVFMRFDYEQFVPYP